MRPSRSSGFTLVETLVAVCLLVAGLVALAELAVHALRADVVAGATTYASVLASDKVEELRTTALASSPPGTLEASVPGYVDHLDRAGHVVGVDADPPTGTAFTRRWEVTALPGAFASAWVVHVEVRPGGTTGGFATARVTVVVRGGGEGVAP